MRVVVGFIAFFSYLFFSYKTDYSFVEASVNVTKYNAHFENQLFYRVKTPLNMYHNQITKETWKIIISDEAMFEMYEEMAPGGFVNLMHEHPYQFEHLSVIRGKVRLSLGTKQIDIEEGHAVHIPASIRHGLSNPFNESVVLRVEYKPGLQMERFFKTLACLSQTGGTFSSGIPFPHHVVRIWASYPGISSFWFFPDRLKDLVVQTFKTIGFGEHECF